MIENVSQSLHHKNTNNCLVIGLCLGNVPNSLIHMYPFIKRIDCVDINELLCKFYKKYLCASPVIHVYSMDGIKFIKSTKHTYSLVFIDIPCSFITKKFMSLINKITAPNSDRIIQINIIGDGDCKKINENLFSNFNIKKKQIDSNLIYILY
jgi:spermidine synthase